MSRRIYAAAVAAVLTLAACSGGTPARPAPTTPAGSATVAPDPSPTGDALKADLAASLDVIELLLLTGCDPTVTPAPAPGTAARAVCELDGQQLQVAVFTSREQRREWISRHKHARTGDQCYPCHGSFEPVLWAVGGVDLHAVTEFARIVNES